MPTKHRNDTKNEKTKDKFCFHFVCFVFFVGKNSFQTISTPSSLPENPYCETVRAIRGLIFRPKRIGTSMSTGTVCKPSPMPGCAAALYQSICAPRKSLLSRKNQSDASKNKHYSRCRPNIFGEYALFASSNCVSPTRSVFPNWFLLYLFNIALFKTKKN